MSLVEKLLHLECHFTWNLREEDVNFQDLLNRLEKQIEMESGEVRVTRAYNSLAYVSFVFEHLLAALTNLNKSEELSVQFHGENSHRVLVVTYGNLAWLYHHMENIPLCEHYLKKVQEITEGSSEEENNDIQSEVLKEKAWAFLKFSGRYYGGARECFRQALELRPKDADLNAGYAIALYRTHHDTPGSVNSPTVEQLQLAIDLNPNNAVLLVFRALRLLIVDQDPKRSHIAVGLVAKALMMSPENPHVMRYAAQFSRRLNSVDFAITQLQEMLMSNPDSGFLHHQIALCYKSKMISAKKDRLYDETQEFLNKCISHLERAVSLKPSFITALAELAHQYGAKRDLMKAEELFQQAFQKAKVRKENIQFVHCLYGKFQQYHQKNQRLAIYHYTEGLRTQDNMGESSECLRKLRNIANVQLSINPNDPTACAIEGVIHELTGRKSEALDWYGKAFDKKVSIEENPLITEVRIWILGLNGAERQVRNMMFHRDVEETVLGSGRPTVLKGTIAKKLVCVTELDLRVTKTSLPKEKWVLSPGPHVVVLAFTLHQGQVTEDTRTLLEDLEMFSEKLWKHVLVLFTNEDIAMNDYISKEGGVLPWLLQKCEHRYYIPCEGNRVTHCMELWDRIMSTVLKNHTMHLVISEKPSCLKFLQESESEKVEMFNPEILDGGTRYQYRLVCLHAGWFHCSSTSLSFRMEGEGEVLYSVLAPDSSYPVSTNHYPLGPVYDITCVRGELSYLQLPHCESSPDDGWEFLTVVRYSGHGVEILNPENITDRHVTVKIPGTSCFYLQNILNWFKRKINAQVLLVYHPQPKNWLHIFLLPRNIHPAEVDKCETGGERIPAPCDCVLEHENKYSMACDVQNEPTRGSGDIKIQPEVRRFNRNKYIYHHPNFIITLPSSTTELKVQLKEHYSQRIVWEFEVSSLKVFQNSGSSADKREDESFFKRHYAELVNRVTCVDAVLDRLIEVLPDECVDEIRAQNTEQKKMRKLMDEIIRKKEFLKLFKALENVHPQVVMDLMQRANQS